MPGFQTVALIGVFLFPSVFARQPSNLQTKLLFGESSVVNEANQTKSFNVSGCSGYNLHSLSETKSGLTAHLSLAGAPCNAFGQDIANLTIQVTYESQSRLHVNIYDTDQKQFTIPEDIIARPQPPATSHTKTSDLVFNYDTSPFAFWISRRSQPQASPLFDTRIASLPQTPIPPVVPTDNSTALDGFPLVFEDQYLQLTSVLPHNANIYGLGEVIASSGLRRDVAVNGTIQTMWARDIQDPINQNVYGSHPIYLEHRFNETTNTSQSHGVFLLSSAGADILLLTPPSSNASIVEYRMIGGTLDFYFFSGPDPKSVIEQYGALIGFPTWQPLWGFGFHLCRWGYHDVNETREQVEKMREANIPLEVMWNDIDLYHAVRDFTSDPVTFPSNEVRTFIQELASNNQRYIPIVDAAIAKQGNASDIYDPYTRGAEQKVFITNPDGSEYIGQVWPGYTVFPDWFANNTQNWWTEALQNWTNSGIEFSGIWLDMNEASSFCDGSCGTGANLSNTTLPFLNPGDPGNPIVDYPECYNSTLSGPSGNLTVNGTLTNSCASVSNETSILSARGVGAAGDPFADLNTPPYAIHNGNGRLSLHTIATNATHAGGFAELDVHNMWGLMEERATHMAVGTVRKGERPFLISRSTFPSSGRWSGHWLGDNWSQWIYMRYSIQGVLQFQLFQIPFVGADTCGFSDNTDEELCNRWMQLAAFTPFYRNHNQRGALSQEPYRWDSVAAAARDAIAIRYALLPYWYTLFANASTVGTPPVRALFFEFPDEPALFDVDSQFLVGSDVLVTPVLEPGATNVTGFFPGRDTTIWRDWYTHARVATDATSTAVLDAPLGHIPVHIRSGAALLLFATPGETITATQAGGYRLLVSLDSEGHATGGAWVDDGISAVDAGQTGPGRNLIITAENSSLNVQGKNTDEFEVEERLRQVVLLGVGHRPTEVLVAGQKVSEGSQGWTYDADVERLVIGTDVDLNAAVTVNWR